MQMQDPSYGVPPQLLPHVHLISSHKYPQFHQLNLDQAYQFLFEAPKVVKQIAPMTWQYLPGPQDGTVFLTWIGGRMANSFATDGYVWADQEQRYTQDFGGYTLEVAVHQSGYRPGLDQISCHQRRRYRFMSKNPNISALPPDPNLWIVHYSQAEPQSCVPVNQVMVSPQVRNALGERQWIESQGRLEQQPFMLHDRDKWPHVQLPGRGAVPGPTYNPGLHSQNPMAHIGNPRFSGQFYQQAQTAAAQQAQVGPSPAKRPRQHAPSHSHSQMPASAAALMATDTSIEDEENVLYGDILDHLTQRDISLTRYMQHHEWMEEVFSSPYATGRIIPSDLGFGLMGELAGLTDGLMNLPTTTDQDKAPAKDSPEPSYKKVTPEQLQEFEKRVKAHMDKGQAELERMKEEHAKKMESMKKGKSLVQAEKRLRNAVWDPADTGNEMWRLERAAFTSGDVTAPKKESADDIVKEVERSLAGTIEPQKEARLVEKGGMKEKAATPPAPTIVEADLTTGDDFNMQMDGTEDEFTQQTTTAPEQQAQPAASPPVSTHQPQQSQSQSQPLQSQPQQQQEQQQQEQQQQQQQQQAPPPQPQQHDNTSAPQQDAQLGNSEAMMEDSLMVDDLNMDVDMDSTLNFDAADPSPKPSTDVAIGSIEPSASNWPGARQQQHERDNEKRHPQQYPTDNSIPGAAVATSANANSNNSEPSTQAGGQPSVADMFNTSTEGGFGDFDNDGLIDFEAGDGGMEFMDNSAFGDAFHDTEADDGGATGDGS